ncbi:MAG TPA: TonB-dependent receptor [Thermoanaerobaculia bacterium]
MSRTSRGRSRALLLLLFSFLGVPLAAFDGRLLDKDGAPLGGVQVTVAGRTGTVRTDADGRFRILPDPALPATLIIVGTRGEIYPPLVVESASGELRVEEAFQESVTVTSGATPNIDAPPAAGTFLVGHEEIEERRPEHLVDALDRVAGVSRRGEGAPGVPVVRGLAAGRTLLLLDDSRVTVERRAGPSGTFLDPFTFGSIEIARGPGSVAYGSDAFGGVIHARPRDPVIGDSQFRYQLTSAFGGSQMRTAGVEYSQSLTETSSISGLLHVRDSNGSDAGDGIEIDNAAYHDHGGALRFLTMSGRGVFRAGLAVDQGRDIGAPAADSLVTRTYYPEEESRRLTASWDSASTDRLGLELRGSLGSYDIITDRERLPAGTTTRQISSSDVTADDASLRAIVTRMAGKARFRGGVDFTSRFNLRALGSIENFDLAGAPTTRTEEVSIDDASKTDTGLFAMVDWTPLARLTTSAGVRVDRVAIRNNGGFFGDRSRDDTAFSGHAAATLGLAPSLTATLQGARGFREPSLSDRYFRGVSGRGFVVGNPELEPETSTQFDGALRWQRGSRSLALLGYHYTIHDLVERFRAGADFNFRNRGKAEVKGLELELASELPLGLALQVTGAIARGEAVDDDAYLDDIAAPNLHAALRWAGRSGSAFVHVFAVGEDDRPGPVETTRAGYTTADLGFGWTFTRAAELRLQVRNVLDKRYPGSADANAALAPGRTLMIGLGGRM